MNSCQIIENDMRNDLSKILGFSNTFSIFPCYFPYRSNSQIDLFLNENKIGNMNN